MATGRGVATPFPFPFSSLASARAFGLAGRARELNVRGEERGRAKGR